MTRVYFIFVFLVVSSTNARVAELSNDITNEITKLAEKQPANAIHIDLPVYTRNDTDIEMHVTDSPDRHITDNTIENKPCPENNKVDNGVALLLTPFIKQGRIDEARNASRVDPTLFLGLESYSGYLTVNETYNSNLFFWYFPIQNMPVDSSPWIIWMQGGPGASSMTGLFDEIGPFKIVSGTLIPNPHTWHTNHSILFIENPVGTGFSFTEHKDGYATDMATYSSHLYTALHQVLQIFPELRRVPLFIAGESYAGKYAPSLGIEIHSHKNIPGNKVNLEGLIVGNAYIDPSTIDQMPTLLYNIGMLDKDQVEVVRPISDSFREQMAANKSSEAKAIWSHLIYVLLSFTHLKHAYNYLSDDLHIGSYLPFLRRDDVKRALHVGDIHFAFVNFTVNLKLGPDFLRSTKHKFETLLDAKYRVLSYCGQLDQMVPCMMASEHYRTWKWQSSQTFLEAPRYPFFYNNKLAGYYKSGGRLTETIIRGAGHMASIDAPGALQNLITKWTHGSPIIRMVDIAEQAIAWQVAKNYSSFVYL